MPENLSALSGRHGLDNNLFEKLVEGARESGTPTPELLRDLAEEFLMGKAITYGSASFYDFLKPEHQGKKVHVCNGSACLLANSQEGVQNKLKSEFDEEEIGHMCCLGRCYENSAFQLNGQNYSGHDIDNLSVLISEAGKYDNGYVLKNNLAAPVLTDNPITINDFNWLFEKISENGADWALDEIKDSNIRGRGGAGFPMGLSSNQPKTPLQSKNILSVTLTKVTPELFLTGIYWKSSHCQYCLACLQRE